jgi:hypothetical protein
MPKIMCGAVWSEIQIRLLHGVLRAPQLSKAKNILRLGRRTSLRPLSRNLMLFAGIRASTDKDEGIKSYLAGSLLLSSYTMSYCFIQKGG